MSAIKKPFPSAMGWLRSVGSFKLHISFAEYRLFYRALLQKRPMILRSLQIEATPYQNMSYFCHKEALFKRYQNYSSFCTEDRALFGKVSYLSCLLGQNSPIVCVKSAHSKSVHSKRVHAAFERHVTMGWLRLVGSLK